MNSFSTMHDLVTAFDKLHISQLRDPRPLRCRIRKYFGPLLPLPLESLGVPVITGWVNDIREQPVMKGKKVVMDPITKKPKKNRVQADSCLSALRTMLNFAVKQNMYYGPNNAKLIQRHRPARRKRYVLLGERPALITEIDREPLMLRVYFYMMYYVAPRPSELQRAQIVNLKLFRTGANWSGVWIKPMTKNGDVQQVPLPSFICSLLAEYLATLPPEQTQLFVGENGRVPSFTWWHNQWAEVRRRAGLKDVQQRDLRRSCATDLTEYLDLVSISKGVLNHRDLNTTQIYVQPVDKRIVEAMNAHVLNTRSHLPQGGNHETVNSHQPAVPVHVPNSHRADEMLHRAGQDGML